MVSEMVGREAATAAVKGGAVPERPCPGRREKLLRLELADIAARADRSRPADRAES